MITKEDIISWDRVKLHTLLIHEVNQHIGVCTGYLKLLLYEHEHDTLSPTQKKYASEIESKLNLINEWKEVLCIWEQAQKSSIDPHFKD